MHFYNAELKVALRIFTMEWLTFNLSTKAFLKHRRETIQAPVVKLTINQIQL